MLLTLLVVVAGGWMLARHINERRVYKALNEMAWQQTRQCPRMIEAGMELIRVVALPPRVLVYHIECSAFNKEMIDSTELIDLNEFLETTRLAALENINNEPTMSDVKRLGLTLEYHYKDQARNPLIDFTITPEDYK